VLHYSRFIIRTPTFEEWADAPHGDGSKTGELTIGHFKEEERHPAQGQDGQVGDEEDRCKAIKTSISDNDVNALLYKSVNLLLQRTPHGQLGMT
jgi:hypothetical protein